MPKKTSNHKQSLKIPKLILLFSKIIALISTKLSVQFSAKLFTTPIKHGTPKRELDMESKSIQKLIEIGPINKKVMTYEYGKSGKKILLSHGWSGRGTQLFKIADEFIKLGYSTISFDAPAHGKSQGNTTIMPEFVETILEIEKQFGPFEAAVGHSLGAMSLLNATKKGLRINCLAIIGSGDVVQDIIDDFATKMELKPRVSSRLRIHFERKYNVDMEDYSAYKSAKEIDIPVLVIHDKNDSEVPVNSSIHIHKNLKKGELFLTEGLGHRKILGDSEVIEKVIGFIESN